VGEQQFEGVSSYPPATRRLEAAGTGSGADEELGLQAASACERIVVQPLASGLPDSEAA